MVRHEDDWLWRSMFGSQDYMSLHPPFALRARIASRLPVTFFGGPQFARPIFIVGAPRSGTTMLFALLDAAPIPPGARRTLRNGRLQGLSSRQINTTTRPGVGKWHLRHRDRIERVINMLEPTMDRMGYATSDLMILDE